MSRSNRAAVLFAPHDLRIEDVPMPVLGERDVLVEVAAVGVCGSDVHYYEHGRIGAHVVRKPLVLGHEVSGRVAAVGEGATRHAVGTRVALEPGVPCGRCRECRAGRYNLCADISFFATPPVNGAFARYVAIHEDFAFELPETVSDVAGALLEPLSVAVWASAKAAVGPGKDVLVTGAGPIGLLCIQVAFALGAVSVVATDVRPARLELASRYGARGIDISGAPLARARIACDVLLECSGSAGALREGVELLRPAGCAICVGMGPDDDVILPLSTIQNRELWLTGTFRYANTYPAAIGLVDSGRVDVESIVTGVYSLDDTEAALRAGTDEPASIKSVVQPTPGGAVEE